jgi:hypothetical protein
MTTRRFVYSIGLWTCRLRSQYKSRVNPFTGEEVRFYIDDGLNQAEREATKVLLSQHGPSWKDRANSIT